MDKTASSVVQSKKPAFSTPVTYIVLTPFCFVNRVLKIFSYFSRRERVSWNFKKPL